jgi:hypothetical protein
VDESFKDASGNSSTYSTIDVFAIVAIAFSAYF